MFVYFCRGLSGNTEERPTSRDYIEILTYRVIILHLEDSRSHGNEAEAERSLAQGARPRDQGARPRDQGARPRDQGARPLLESNQDSLSELRSTDLKDQG